MQETVRIVRMQGRDALAQGLVPGIEAVLFATAARVYPEGPERDAFREKWLGRFLDCERDVLLVALGAQDAVAGYLVGTFDNAAESPRFLDMPHFREHFSAQCAQYPAHLHINLLAQHRGKGLGAQMIDRFGGLVRQAGLPGMHVTTGRGMRNVAFYLRNGFSECGTFQRNGGAMLFLGRRV
ncbi:MAG: GNAT family N-acetyltransferase [Hyphomicrobiaceae bacterium]|nr:GNAT family N-acetyltransferase [Hyphomicrobiaceae bacterium]